MLRLPDAFGERFVPRLGFHHCQLVIAIDQHVVGNLGVAAPPVAFDATGCDGILAQDAAALDYAPTGGRQSGINVFGSGFGFVQQQPSSECLNFRR